MTTPILSQNLRTLMDAHIRLKTQAAVAKECDINQRTVGRILNQEHSCTMRQIESLASAFNLHIWQLLVADLDPKDPPVCEISSQMREIHEKLKLLVNQIPGH